MGRQQQLCAHHARTYARPDSFLSSDVHFRRRDELSDRLHAGDARGVPIAAAGLASHQFYGRPFPPHDVRHYRIRDLGRHLRPFAIGDGQAGESSGRGAAFLDGAGRLLHLRHLSIDRRHDPGTRLDARIALHPVRHRHAELLRVAWRGRFAHVLQPHRIRLERVAHVLWAENGGAAGRVATHRGGRGVNKLILIVGGSTVVYACLALMMGVLPGIELSRAPAGAGVEPLSALEAEGRQVYVANGCSYCHTQQVRPLDEDKVFGRPSAASDFKYQTPELLGSERTGPDLTNIGVRQPSSVWQYIHLYEPRAVVPESIMPSFAWLFEVVDQAPAGVSPVPLPRAYAPAHGVVVPTRDAEALIAYLAALKQPPWAGSAGAAAGTASAATAASSAAPVGAAAPAGGYDAAKGASLYTANCSACHQASGGGLPGAFPALKGNDVVDNDDPTQHIHVVLGGLQGASVGGVVYAAVMPPFAATLSDADVADIIDYERSSWGNHARPAAATQVAAERAKPK